MTTIVDTLYKDINDLVTFLQNREEISLLNFSDSNLRKNLLLASASYYENEIQKIIERFTEEKSSNCVALVSFIRNKGIKRQYHTYFNWDSNNINNFLGLFGEDFKDSFKVLIDAKSELKDAIVAFIEVGRERNRLVHQEFGSFVLEKTSEEIFELHNKALIYIMELDNELKNAT